MAIKNFIPLESFTDPPVDDLLEVFDVRYASNNFQDHVPHLAFEWQGKGSKFDPDLKKDVRELAFPSVKVDGSYWFPLNDFYSEYGKMFSDEHPKQSLRGFYLPSNRWLGQKEIRLVWAEALRDIYYDDQYLQDNLLSTAKVPNMSYSYLAKKFPLAFKSSSPYKGALHLCNHDMAIAFFQWLQHKTGYPLGDWFSLQIAKLLGDDTDPDLRRDLEEKGILVD